MKEVKWQSQKNSKNYRTKGDIVSILDIGRKNNINLENPNKSSGNSLLDTLKSHDIDNIKNQNINI